VIDHQNNIEALNPMTTGSRW